MAQTTAEKLGIKPGLRVRAVGAVPESAENHVGAPPEDAGGGKGQADIIILYAESLDDVDGSARGLIDDIASGGRFWIAYRKGATRVRLGSQAGGESLHRDSLQRVLAANGLNGVTLISLDDTWSAMRVKTITDSRHA